MAKKKTKDFKILLHSFREKRRRAPIWVFLKSKKRYFPVYRRIHWRRTKFGHRIRRLI